MSYLVYDAEILRCIPQKGLNPQTHPDLDFCAGWEDFEHMGISVIGAFDSATRLYRVFLADNFDEFQSLVDECDTIVGFNSISFDDRLCAANGLRVTTTYDLLREVRIASGQPPDYVPGVTRSGYNLNALAHATLGLSKSGTGEMAPVLWQRGQRGQVIDYCLRDVALTWWLYESRYGIRDPHTGEVLSLAAPRGEGE